MHTSRRNFIKTTSTLGLAMSISPVFSFDQKSAPLIGHGDFQYRVDEKWGMLDPAKVPVVNCHEMVMDRKGRMIMLTDEVKNKCHHLRPIG